MMDQERETTGEVERNRKKERNDATAWGEERQDTAPRIQREFGPNNDRTGTRGKQREGEWNDGK